MAEDKYKDISGERLEGKNIREELEEQDWIGKKD